MKKGFTLIELLVVVLIIGILSAVALPQYTKAVEKSRIAEAESVLKTMREQLELLMMESGPTQPVRRTNILVQELYTVAVLKKNVKNVAIQNKELMVESG